jgi:hypothetical protein
LEKEVKDLREQVKKLTEYNDALYNRINLFFDKIREMDKINDSESEMSVSSFADDEMTTDTDTD